MRNKFIRVRACALALAWCAMPMAATGADTPESEFMTDVDLHGGIVSDLSESAKIKLSEPRFGYVNISGITDMPRSKTDELQAWLEFCDGEGNYFKILLSAKL